jgi:3-hydroxyisobutyrate dehydrogenase-like beta-hydroxyacid dehydrogenase
MAKIGIIGVGLLGSAIATRLTAGGNTVLGYDLIPERRLGASSAQQVATECRTIILCLPTSEVVSQVLSALKLIPGTTIIDATTGEPDAMAAMGVKLAKDSVDYLDATVLGSSRVVRNGGAVVTDGEKPSTERRRSFGRLPRACFIWGPMERAPA